MPASSSIYGVKPVSKPNSKASAGSLAFASSLSSLLASSAAEDPKNTKAHSSKAPKESIYTAHRQASKKRPHDSTDAPDLSQKHARTTEGVDNATWQRSKRKMEEKARLYASMKRGDYVPPSDGRDREAEGLIDFDRKWAAKEDGGSKEAEDTSSDSYGDSGEDEETVEWEDEFGRVRRGTKRQADREMRSLNARSYAEQELAGSKARPHRPDNVIYGDVVQAAAFNPDEPIAAKMADLARKRDRSMTPPEETHYDATREIRTKGVGFFQFSKDEKERKQEMDDLERERKETEKGRREREERKKERMAKIEERRKKVGVMREERLAEKFLNDLELP